MTLPLPLTTPPMESRAVSAIPRGSQWAYEPKWDGFRCLAFRDGTEISLQSKAGQPLARYFPELVEALATVDAPRFILDGEIVVPQPGGGLSFDSLLQRIHPAASRIQRLAAETPAVFIIFDLLADPTGKAFTAEPLRDRRPRLETFYKQHLEKYPQLRLSPTTTSFATAEKWFSRAGTATDGLMAKNLDAPYAAGERDAMVKIKPRHTADCVVGGFRYATKNDVVGSLLLGLYNKEGLLDHIGFCSGLTAATRAEITPRLEKLIEPPGFTGSAPGGPSRWSTDRSRDWQPLRPELVVEVAWDHFTNGRFRHGTRLLRWRPDKAPRQCTMDQVQLPGPGNFALLTD